MIIIGNEILEEVHNRSLEKTATAHADGDRQLAEGYIHLDLNIRPFFEEYGLKIEPQTT